MTNSGNVAIILPVYNVAEYLDDALKSILNQTYKNYTVIAVNDGSTDNSLDILKKWQGSFGDRLSIYTKGNGGLSDARNYGLQYIGDADYVYFMDSDDMIHPDLLRDCVSFASRNQLDYVKFDYYMFNDSELEVERSLWEAIQKFRKCNRGVMNEYVEIRHPDMEVLSKEKFSERFNNVGVWDCLIRSQFLIGSNGVRFCKGYIHEDLVFDAELLTQMLRFGYIHKPYYFYRRRGGSITSNELSKTNAPHSIESVKHNFKALHQLQCENRSNPANMGILDKIMSYNMLLAQNYFSDPMLVSLYSDLGYSKLGIAKCLAKKKIKMILSRISV